MSHVDCADTKFDALLQDQIRNEFTASQQYVAIAVHFDDDDLPQLAAYFYRQAVEERNHAMMLVRYLLDRGVKVEIPGTDPVRNEFETVRDALRPRTRPGAHGHRADHRTGRRRARRAATTSASSSCSGSSRSRSRKSPR